MMKSFNIKAVIASGVLFFSLFLGACSSKKLTPVSPQALIVSDFNKLDCRGFDDMDGLLYANQAGLVFDYNLPVVTAEEGQTTMQYETDNPEVATVETLTVKGKPKMRIKTLKKGYTLLTITASVPKMVLRRDVNGDGVLDTISYVGVSCKKIIEITVKADGIVERPQANLVTLTTDDFPANIGGQASATVEFDEATALASKGTPLISYGIEDTSIATLKRENGKVSILFIKAGQTKLTIKAEVDESSEIADINGDGILDKVIYPKTSKELDIPLAVSSLGVQEVTESNLLTISNVIPLNINGGASSTLSYNLPTAVATKGEPNVQYSIGNENIAQIGGTQNGRILINLNAAGTTTFKITATVPEIKEQRDVNGDGVLDNVTYPALSQVVEISITVN